MVTVGFVVEGPSEKKIVESDAFAKWMANGGMIVATPIVIAGGQGGMIDGRLNRLARSLRKQAGDIDRTVALMDLDPDEDVKCIQARKEKLGSTSHVDLVVVARKTIESWFLADQHAMGRWIGDSTFFEDDPEGVPGMPWERLKQIGRQLGRGPGGSKVTFAKRIVKHGFTIEGAAQHPKCPSARYFIERVGSLTKPLP